MKTKFLFTIVALVLWLQRAVVADFLGDVITRGIYPSDHIIARTAAGGFRVEMSGVLSILALLLLRHICMQLKQAGYSLLTWAAWAGTSSVYVGIWIWNARLTHIMALPVLQQGSQTSYKVHRDALLNPVEWWMAVMFGIWTGYLLAVVLTARKKS